MFTLSDLLSAARNNQRPAPSALREVAENTGVSIFEIARIFNATRAQAVHDKIDIVEIEDMQEAA